MAFENVQITSTRNGGGAVVGYRQDLAENDVVVASLTSYVGVTSIHWELVGRPSFSAAGGAGPEPINLGTSQTSTFVVDPDVTGYKMDGSYKLQATLNPGSPGEVRIVTVLARVSGITIPRPGGGTIALRKPAGFEALEDTADPTIKAGYAKQIDWWFEALRQAITGGIGGNVTLAGAYASGTSTGDQTMVLSDANGGGIIVDATSGSFTGTSALRVNTAAGGPIVVDRATGRVGVGIAVPLKDVHVKSAAPTVRLDRTGGVAFDVSNVVDELQFLNGATVLGKFKSTGGLQADLGVGIGAVPATAPVLAFGDGTGVAVSGAGTARVRYNGPTTSLQFSVNAGPWVDFAQALHSYTTVSRAHVILPQQDTLDFSANFSVVDDVGNASTDVDLANVGPGAGLIGGGGIASVTLDAKGRVTAVATATYATVASLFYQTVDAAGAPVTQRPTLNFSDDFAVVDNGGATRTDVSLVAIHETAGPTRLAIGAIPDGGYLQRSGTSLVGTTTIPASAITLAAGAIGFGSAGGILTGDAANAHWDAANNRAGFRTSAPAFQLHLVDQSTASDRGLVVGTHASGNPGPRVLLRRSLGTFASPGAVASGNYLGILNWDAYTGTQYLSTAAIQAVVNGTVSGSSVPTEMFFNVNSAGVSNDPFGTNAITAIRITGTAAVLVGAQGGIAAAAYNPGNLTIVGTESITRFNPSVGVSGPFTDYARGRGSATSPAAVVPFDTTGGQRFWGWDGGAWVQGMEVSVIVDGNETVSTGHVPMSLSIFPSLNGSAGEVGAFHISSRRDVVLGLWNGLATSSTSGFVWLPQTAGPPTGVPVTPGMQNFITTNLASQLDSTDDRFYVYNASWKPYGQYTGGLASGFLKNTTGTGIWTVDTATYLSQAYTTVDAAGTPLTQRFFLNFTADFAAVDNAGATRTDVSLANFGPGAVTTGGSGIASITTDAKGRVSSIATATYLTSAGATPGTYNNVTVAASGLVTSGSNVAYLTQAYVTVKNSAGSSLTQRSNLKFLGDFAVADATPDTTVALVTQGGLTAGSYTLTNLTVNAAGIITAASNGAATGTFYQTVDANGSAVTQRPVLNFSADLPAVDNAGAGRTDVSLVNTGPGAGLIGGAGIKSITLDAKGRVTAATTATYLIGVGTAPGTFASVTVNGDGLVTGGTAAPGAAQIGVSDGTKFVGDPSFLFDTANHLLTLASADSGTYSVKLTRAGDQTIEKSGSGVFWIGTLGAQPIKMYTGGLTRLVIDSVGNIQLPHYTTAGFLHNDASGNVATVGTIGGFRMLASNSAGTDFSASDELLLDVDQLDVSQDGAIAWRNMGGGAMIGAVNYEQVRAFWSSSVWTLKSEKAGTGTVRNMAIISGDRLDMSATGTATLGGGLATTLGVPGTTMNILIDNTPRIFVDLGTTVSSSTGNPLNAFITSGTITFTGNQHNTFVLGQNAVSLGNFTYSGGGVAKTIDFAASVAIQAAPVASGSLTITNAYAFWVQSGKTRVDGVSEFNGFLNATASANIGPNLALNGSFPGANDVFTIGSNTDPTRDHVRWFIGGGINLDTPTNSFFEITALNTQLTNASNTGIMSTVRLGSIHYSNAPANSPTVAEVTTLYIAGPPTVSGITVTNGLNALHVATGSVQFDADVLLCVAGGSLSVFGSAGVSQQTGGAAAATGSYTGNEQGMINRMYAALRNYGLLS
jgi:hypothetical protein